MKSSSLLAVLSLFAAAPVLASQCEDTFQKKGNPITGTTYTASTSMAGLSVAAAIQQMRGIAIGEKLDVLDMDAEGGSMLLELPETGSHKPLPIIVAATNEAGATHVSLQLKTGRGAFASGDRMRDNLCGMLAKLKPGKAGLASAAAGKSAAATVTEISAVQLSQQIDRQAKDNVGAINARYKGKSFRVSGSVSSMVEDGGTYTVIFKTPGKSLFEVPIKCKMEANQSAYALSVREGEKVTLTGTFDTYDRAMQHFYLKDCRR